MWQVFEAGDLHTGLMVGKPDWKSPLGRPRYGWKGNIEIDVSEVDLGAWTELMWRKIGASGGIF
jgi:hypothetical protein